MVISGRQTAESFTWGEHFLVLVHREASDPVMRGYCGCKGNVLAANPRLCNRPISQNLKLSSIMFLVVDQILDSVDFRKFFKAFRLPSDSPLRHGPGIFRGPDPYRDASLEDVQKELSSLVGD